jgi:hypothetical protein
MLPVTATGAVVAVHAAHTADISANTGAITAPASIGTASVSRRWL